MEKLEEISSESYEEFCYRQDEKLFTVTPKMLLDKHIKAAEAFKSNRTYVLWRSRIQTDDTN